MQVDFSPVLDAQRRVLPAVQAGFATGQARNALMRLYDEDPANDQSAQQDLMTSDPNTGFAVNQQRQRQQLLDQQQGQAKLEYGQAQQAQSMERGLLGARFMAPATEADWVARRAAALSRGVPAESIPEMFDPNWQQQARTIVETTQGDRDVRVIGDSLVDTSGNVIFQNPYVTVRDANGQTTVIPRSQIDQYYGMPTGSVPPPPPGFVLEGGAGGSSRNFPADQ